MATVYLKDDNIKVKVKPGMSLRQVATKTGASMEFGCRVGDCGTCIAKIDEGMALLNERTPKEITFFEMLDHRIEDKRLMCQSVVESQEGEIVISYISL